MSNHTDIQLTPSATFTSDLGLDSLDAVEVVMAIEEEFGIEIPDAEADEINTVAKGMSFRLSLWEVCVYGVRMEMDERFGQTRWRVVPRLDDEVHSAVVE